MRDRYVMIMGTKTHNGKNYSLQASRHTVFAADAVNQKVFQLTL